MIDPTLTGPLMEAAKEPLANITNPPTRSIGRFFGDTLDFWFSNRELKYAKKQIMDEIALRKFREECEAEFAKIPEDELVPPRKALLLPALDAAEYYVEEEELRKLFAKLIGAICDGRKASKVHPSFASIIQQLSPLDAENLSCFWNKKGGYTHQFEVEGNALVVSAYFDIIQTGCWFMPEYLFFGNANEDNMFLQSISLRLLELCGLIQLDEETNEQVGYKPNQKEKNYLDLSAITNPPTLGDIIDERQSAAKKVWKTYQRHIDYLVEHEYLEDGLYGTKQFILNHAKKYVASLTQYGMDFCFVCLPPLPSKEALL